MPAAARGRTLRNMESSRPTHHRRAAPRVVIAGGGIAAVETLLALRADAGRTALDVTMISPAGTLVYRPAAVGETFGRPPVRRYPLAPICAEHDARLVTDRLVAVDHPARMAVTAAGARIPYDALVVAVGARQHAALPGATTVFLDDDERDSLRELLRAIDTGDVDSVAFVAPADLGWTLPLYEVALLTARHVREHAPVPVSLVLVTPEEVPLAAFRGAGSDAVARLLEDAGITALTGSYVRHYDGRSLTIVPGGRQVPAAYAVALPALHGPALVGLPADQHGFVRADEHGRVPGLDGVYAIGDAATFPIKQGGLAAQQADRVAAQIARAAGADASEPSTRPRLRAILITGGPPLYLQATLAGGESVASSASEAPPWWPPTKVAARRLGPYLADREPTAAATGPGHGSSRNGG